MLKIGNHQIGPGNPTYIVAEMSANHNKSFNKAVKIVKAAKKSGADAIKIQTYIPETMTISSEDEMFSITNSSPWKGKSLFNLYQDAYTPWEWHPKLKEIANNLGLDFFSTPFDTTAINYLEEINIPAYKIASFEIVDLELIRNIAKTKKPILLSTGMANLSEIFDAVNVIQNEGNNQFALLKCTSAYPAFPEEMNLRTIPHLAQAFGVPTGLSDHSLGIAIPIAAVALGACIIEKHLTLSRNDPGPDSSFSMEPNEFKHMVESVRIAEKSLGIVSYSLSKQEKENIIFRRSLFVVKDIQKGELFSIDNVKSIRPGLGISPKYLSIIIGKKAAKDIPRGTPFEWNFLN